MLKRWVGVEEGLLNVVYITALFFVGRGRRVRTIEKRGVCRDIAFSVR